MTSLANRRSAILLFSFPDCLHSHRTRLVIKEKEIVAELHEVDVNNIDEEIKFISPYNDNPITLHVLPRTPTYKYFPLF